MRALLTLGLLVALSLPTMGQSGVRSGYTPQTSSDRWHKYLEETVASKRAYLRAAGGALIDQATNTPSEWHRTLAGYGKRYPSNFGTFTIEDTIHELGAAAFDYDSRYLHCQCTGMWPRSRYAITSGVLSYKADGRRHLDLTKAAAAYGSGMLTVAWYPHRYSAFDTGVRFGHTQFAFVFGGNLLDEFTPD
ncbi:MAG TPA: hypothetical protein VGC88_01015, partial [Terriglobales bacterium]